MRLLQLFRQTLHKCESVHTNKWDWRRTVLTIGLVRVHWSVTFDFDFRLIANQPQLLGHLFNWGLFGALSVQVCKLTRYRCHIL
jgi:hypothetical protein